MSNPVLVEVTRGNLIECIHRGSVAIADAEGNIRFSRGDVLSPFCPRSALKPLQALPLIESGAADAFHLGPVEIALACASHYGEPMHVTTVSGWLEKIGCSVEDLACGPEAPRNPQAYADLKNSGAAPGRLHNGCSGKHAAFLTIAQHLQTGTVSYIHIDHPVQKLVAETVKRLCGVERLDSVVDDCTAPNFLLTLTAFAKGLAKIAGRTTLGADRIVSSMSEYPELVGGTDHPCTEMIKLCDGKAVVKNGAEGVYAAILPGNGLGIAIKIDDGAMRAAETALAAILLGLGVADEGMKRIAYADRFNSRGAAIGKRLPGAALSKADLMAI